MIDDTSQEFINRHIGPSSKDQKKMLDYIGSESLDQLINDTVPTNILLLLMELFQILLHLGGEDFLIGTILR